MFLSGKTDADVRKKIWIQFNPIPVLLNRQVDTIWAPIFIYYEKAQWKNKSQVISDMVSTIFVPTQQEYVSC